MTGLSSGLFLAPAQGLVLRLVAGATWRVSLLWILTICAAWYASLFALYAIPEALSDAFYPAPLQS